MNQDNIIKILKIHFENNYKALYSKVIHKN